MRKITVTVFVQLCVVMVTCLWRQPATPAVAVVITAWRLERHARLVEENVVRQQVSVRPPARPGRFATSSASHAKDAAPCVSHDRCCIQHKQTNISIACLLVSSAESSWAICDQLSAVLTSHFRYTRTNTRTLRQARWHTIVVHCKSDVTRLKNLQIQFRCKRGRTRHANALFISVFFQKNILRNTRWPKTPKLGCQIHLHKHVHRRVTSCVVSISNHNNNNNNNNKNNAICTQ